MEYTKNMRFPKPGYDDAADIGIITSSFDKIEDAAGVWNSFSNFGNAVLEGEKNITITPKLPIYSSIFAVTFKAPKTFEEGDTITINEAVYNLMEGSDPALNEAFIKDEVITMNFDDGRRLCWSSAGGGAPRELPAQISGMTATVVEGNTPTVRFTWNNPNDKNFAGMVLLVKEGSAPNSPTDGTEVFRGTSESYTYTATNWERTYFARGFAYNSQRKYQLDAQGAIASAKPSKIPPVCLDLTATPDGDTCKLTWLVQNSMYLDKVVLVQKIGSAPASPTDGTKLYEGAAEEFTATNLQNGVHYFWTIFALNATGEYLAPAKSVDYTPQLIPETYEFFECLTANQEWKPPTDGIYRITCIGKCADGLTAPKPGSSTVWGIGGAGGGSGGISRSILQLDSSKKYHCTIDNTISSFDSLLSATAAVGREPGNGVGGNEFNVTGAQGGAGGAVKKAGMAGGNEGCSPGIINTKNRYCAGSGGGGANLVLPDSIPYDDTLYSMTQRSLASFQAGRAAGCDYADSSHIISDGNLIYGTCHHSEPYAPSTPSSYPAFNPAAPMFYGGGSGGGGGYTTYSSSGDHARCTGFTISRDPAAGSAGSPGAIIIEKGVF